MIAEYCEPERIRREIAAPEGWDGWIVAVEEETVIGAGGGGMTEPGVAEIFVLYLDPTRRGEGIGTLILDAITEQQRAQGAREQWVSVEPENRKGLPFYFARGFEVHGQRPEWGTTPEEGHFLSGSCDDSSLSSPPQDGAPLVTFANAGPGEGCLALFGIAGPTEDLQAGHSGLR